MGYLNDFYRGNKNPQDKRIIRGSAYDIELKKFADLEQRLLDLLLCDGLDLFTDYIMQANTVLGVAAEDSFVDGFRHGVQSLLDALEIEIEDTNLDEPDEEPVFKLKI